MDFLCLRPIFLVLFCLSAHSGVISFIVFVGFEPLYTLEQAAVVTLAKY